jgi:uncharacterized membrane protein YkvA (DUF1232 family)
MFDPYVALPAKATVLGALAYLVLPYDFLPEGFLGPLGFTEDIFLMIMALLNMTSGYQIASGKLSEHWAGDPEVLKRIVEVSRQVQDKLPFFRRIHEWFQGVQRGASFDI